jgi:hypothetical protein
MFPNRSLSSVLATVALAFSTFLGAVSFVGCERKERVLDIETPGADVEVDRNIDTGEVEVDVNKNE